MRWDRRVRELEEKHRVLTTCPLCKNVGGGGLRLIFVGETEELEPCPTCGKVGPGLGPQLRFVMPYKRGDPPPSTSTPSDTSGVNEEGVSEAKP
jgi:hypothetical protein